MPNRGIRTFKKLQKVIEHSEFHAEVKTIMTWCAGYSKPSPSTKNNKALDHAMGVKSLRMCSG